MNYDELSFFHVSSSMAYQIFIIIMNLNFWIYYIVLLNHFIFTKHNLVFFLLIQFLSYTLVHASFCFEQTLYDSFTYKLAKIESDFFTLTTPSDSTRMKRRTTKKAPQTTRKRMHSAHLFGWFFLPFSTWLLNWFLVFFRLDLFRSELTPKEQ